jgi:hypothetical protein
MAIGFKMGGITPFVSVPNGKTVLPVNDVDLLLQCAGIKGSTITTLAELFADTTTLQAVINSNNAIDYLVRSTTFAKRKELVPTMTSATTPSGVVTQSSIYNNNDGFAGWRAFNGILVGGSGTIWHSEASSNAWIQYEFPTNCKVELIKIWDRNSDNIQGTYNVNFKRSSDGEVIKSFSYSPTNSGVHEIVVDNNNNGNICRLEYTNPASPNNYTIIAELQFYGEAGFTDNATAMTLIGANNYASNTLLDDSTWLNAICNSTYFESVLNAKVPVMTSNTTPYGKASASSEASSSGLNDRDAYTAFDGLSSTGWISNTKGNSWIQYQFVDTVKFYMVTKKDIYVRFNTFKMQTSTDGTTWDDVTAILTNSLDMKVIVDIVKSCRYVRLQILSNTTPYNDGCYGTTEGLQFYGRQDV